MKLKSETGKDNLLKVESNPNPKGQNNNKNGILVMLGILSKGF